MIRAVYGAPLSLSDANGNPRDMSACRSASCRLLGASSLWFTDAMTADPLSAERTRLTARLAELEAEQNMIRYTLSVLDRLVTDDGHPAGVNDAVESRMRAYLRRGGTSAFAVRAIYQGAEPQRVEILIERMHALGWTSEAENEVESVRAALSRIVKDDVAHRVGHGMYAPNPALSDALDRSLPAYAGHDAA